MKDYLYISIIFYHTKLVRILRSMVLYMAAKSKIKFDHIKYYLRSKKVREDDDATPSCSETFCVLTMTASRRHLGCDKIMSILFFRRLSKNLRLFEVMQKIFLTTSWSLHAQVGTEHHKICGSGNFMKPTWSESKFWQPLLCSTYHSW